MSHTAADIVQRALTKARIFSPLEPVPEGIMTQCFSELNDLLDSWSLDNYMVLADVRENFPLVADKESYTWGTGGEFNSSRPFGLKDETYVREGGIDYNVAFLPPSVYRSQNDKSGTGLPSLITLEPGDPLVTLFLWPNPKSGLTIYLKSTKKLTSFSSLVASYDLPAGFPKMVISNLAVEISSLFGKSVSSELAYSASESLRLWKNHNRPKHAKPMTTPDFTGLMNGTGGGSGGINNGPWS